MEIQTPSDRPDELSLSNSSLPSLSRLINVGDEKSLRSWCDNVEDAIRSESPVHAEAPPGGVKFDVWFDEASMRCNKSRDNLAEFRRSHGDVPASVVVNHRQNSQQLDLAASFGRSGRSSAASPGAGASPATVPEVPEAELVEKLLQLAVETECLLRVPLASAEALATVQERVRAGIAFDHSLTELAHAHAVLKGKAFQDILAALRTRGAAHSQLENSGKDLKEQLAAARAAPARPPPPYGLPEVEWSALIGEADGLRQLVRIKLADDNDLKAAQCALAGCFEFFSGLDALAARRGATPFDTLQTLS